MPFELSLRVYTIDEGCQICLVLKSKTSSTTLEVQLHPTSLKSIRLDWRPGSCFTPIEHSGSWWEGITAPI